MFMFGWPLLSDFLAYGTCRISMSGYKVKWNFMNRLTEKLFGKLSLRIFDCPNLVVVETRMKLPRGSNFV